MTASLPTSHPARYSLALLLVVAFALNLLYGMSPVFAAGAPIAFLSVPNEGFIGEEFTFTVSFDNTHPADTGYGPYIDLVLPAAGVDGAGTATDDGITFRGASYLGTPVTPVAPPFICTGSFTHPLTRLNVSCTPGSQIIVLQPPYGSFTAIQPPAEIVITAELSDHADLNVPLSMEARAGFFLGSDPLDNPLSDPPILQPGSGVATYTPIFWTLTKTYIGPEDETATGPNFPHQYRIDIDIADGQTIAPLALSDLLPPTMQYVAVVDTRIHNVSVGTTPGATPATTVPGGTLTREFVSVTGTPSAADATLLFSFFVPRLDASSEAVLPAASGDDFVATNDALAIGTWVPTDHRDLPLTGMLNDLTTIDHELEEQSIAIQKHVANPALPHSPNDILTYTLDIQVSDYFAFEDLIVVDHLSDGLRFDDDATPILACTEHGTASSGSFAITNYTVSDNWTDQNGLVPPDPGLPAPPHTLDPAANDGTTTLTFKLSDQLISLGADAQLLGGGVPSGGLGTDPLPNNPPLLSGPTNCQISYQAIIQDQYTDTFLSGDQSVDQGHILEHNALIDGAALDVSNLVPTGLREDDDTTAGVQIGRGDLFKSIYAVNGDLLCPPGNCSGTALPPGTLIKPGDSVTYRLSLTLPSSDVDGLQLIDYLPLPIFDVNDNVAPIISAITSFDPTVSAATPPVGTAKFGPSDDFTAESGIIPDLSVDPLTNSVIFDYGDYDDPTNDANTIDLLLTVTASFDPFADKLLLTNQVRELEEPTNAGAQMLDKIVQLRINEPELRIRKGVAAVNNPDGSFSSLAVPAGVTINPTAICPLRLTGTAPMITSANVNTAFDANLSDADAGDQVTFAIVVENIGSSPNGAFDIQLRDLLPSGFTYVPGSLCVNLGSDGSPINYTSILAGFFDPTAGIELLDPGDPFAAQGVLGAGEDRLDATPINDGNNIALVTFNALINNTVEAGQVLTNQATLFNYSSGNGGADFTVVDLENDTTVTVAQPLLTKSLISTSEAHTSEAGTGTPGNPRFVAIGEIVRYRLAVKIPEGTLTDLQLVDNLPSGLTFLDDGTIRAGFVANMAGLVSNTINDPGLHLPGNELNVASLNPVFALTNAEYGSGPFDNGDDLTISLGTVVNSDNDADDEFVIVEFNTLVNNSLAGSNQAGDNRDNRFSVYLNGSQAATSESVQVQVVEPALNISKAVTPDLGDTGDIVTYTLLFQNSSEVNTTTGFDVEMSDTLPNSLEDITLISVTPLGGASGIVSSLVGNVLTVDAATMPPGSGVEVVYTARLASGINPGQQIDNTAYLLYTSLPGTNGTSGNPTGSVTPDISGSDTGERDGSGMSPNSYAESAHAQVTVFVPNPLTTIVATSEGHTAENNPRPVAIGEIVRYRLEIQLAEGASPGFQFQDNLPDGLRFLDDATARVAFIANNGVINSTTLSGAGLQVNGNASDLALVNPSFTLPSGAISGGPFVSGTDVVFSLGDLTNADSDSDEEYIVLEFNALVENISGNQAATDLDTTYDVMVGGVNRATSIAGPESQVVIHEPALSISKDVTPTVADAGDTITYTVVVENESGPVATTAFDAVFSDQIPASLTNLSLVSATPAGGATGVISTVVNDILTVTVASMPTGSSVTLVFTADLVSTVIPDLQFTNVATIEYTSLPGASGTTTNPTGSLVAGGSGDDTGERSGNGNDANDYYTSDQASTLVPGLSFAQTLATTSALHTLGSDVAIGEIVTYRFTVALPEGITPPLQIKDNLPPGMAFVPGSVNVDTGAFNGLVSVPNVTSFAGSGDDVTIDFGTIIVVNDNDDNNNSFVVELQALVLDLASNSGIPLSQTSLTNNATLIVAGDTTINGGNVTTTVVEPRMGISKRFTPNQAAANDTVLVTLQVKNTGTTEAFEVIVSDVLTNVELLAPTEVTTPAGFIFTSIADTPSLGQTTVRYTGGSIPAGASLSFSFNVTLAADVSGGQVVPNRAIVTQATTMPGTDLNERDEPDVSGDDNLTVVTPDLRLAKDDGQTLAIPSEVLVYSLLVENIGDRDASGVVVSELVPANSTFDATASTPGWSCADSSPAGTPCNFTVGNLATGDSSTVLFAVTVNSLLPAEVSQISNSASVADDGTNGSDPTPGNNSDDDTDTLSAVPDLTVTKTDSGVVATPGTVVSYRLDYANVGNQDATGVVVSEIVPAHSSFNATTSTAGWSCANESSAGTTCTFAIGSLSAATSDTLTFAVNVIEQLPAGVNELVNSVTIADDGHNGSDPTPGDNSDSDVTPLNATPDLMLSKDDGGTSISANAVLTYTLSYENVGNQDATGVQISETVPANTRFNAAASTAGWSCADRSPAGTLCTLLIGSVPGGTSGTIAFALVVDSPLPAGITQIVNSASVADDGSNGSDPTPADNNDNDTTPVVALPDLVLTKDDSGVTTSAGALLSYSLAYDNVGSQNATGVAIYETVPMHTTFNAAASTPGWNCPPGSSSGTPCVFTIGNLAAGANSSLTFAVTVDNTLPAGVSSIANSASISDDGSNGNDPTPANNGDEEDTPLNAAPDLTISNADGGISTTAGAVFTYTLNYANVGTQEATGVTISETVPPHTSFYAASSSAGWSCDDGSSAGTVCSFPAGDTPAGATGTVYFAVTVNTSLPAGVEQIINDTSISDDGSNGSDLTPADNSADEDTPLNATPDLTISEDDGLSQVLAGQLVTYTLTIRNVGNQDATGVVISDSMPLHTSFVAASNGASELAGVVTWPAVDLAAGASITRSVSIQLDTLLPVGYATVINTASVADDGSNGADPTPGNNSDDDRDQIPPDLALSNEDNGVSVGTGQILTYTLTYTNVGTVTATGVVVNETVPFYTRFAAAQSSGGWSCADGAAAGTACLYSVGTLAPGASNTITFTVLVDTTLPAGVHEIDNSARIADDGTGGSEPTPGDNRDDALTPVVGLPDLRLHKDDGGITALPGQTIVYTLSYSNQGTQGATGVVLSETVPLHTVYTVAGSSPGWSCANGSTGGTVCTYPIGDLPAGANGTLTFAATIVDPFPAGVNSIVNSALLSDDGLNGSDPTPSDNDDGVETQVSPTAINLVSFTAAHEDEGVRVRWVTANDQHIFGFRIYRSTNTNRATAEEVTIAPILTSGHSSEGASYEWLDRTALLDTTYFYWLEEIEMNGTASEHGPISTPPRPNAHYNVYLPMVIR